MNKSVGLRERERRRWGKGRERERERARADGVGDGGREKAREEGRWGEWELDLERWRKMREDGGME